MLDYLASFLTFTAALVGIIGDTYNKRKVGLRKVRPLGWIAISCALVGVTISIVQTSNKNKEIEENLISNITLRKLAFEEIDHSLLFITDAFSVLAADFSNDQDSVLVALKDFHQFKVTDNFINFLKELNFNSTGPSLIKENYGHFIYRQLIRANTSLNTTLNIYTPYLNKEDIQLISSLRQNEIFQFLPEVTVIGTGPDPLIETQVGFRYFNPVATKSFLNAYIKLKLRVKEVADSDNKK